VNQGGHEHSGNCGTPEQSKLAAKVEFVGLILLDKLRCEESLRNGVGGCSEALRGIQEHPGFHPINAHLFGNVFRQNSHKFVILSGARHRLIA
jgi:hypothetical protein